MAALHKTIVAALISAAVFVCTADDVSAQEPPRTSFVVVHGAWGGGWDWWTVDSMLTSRGHRVERVTLTGLGERVHLASRQIGLETHVTDVVNRIVWEQLDDVVLIGHSYGGVVATLAADRIPDRIRRVVYVDAILPENGRSVADVVGPWIVEGAVDGMVIPSWSEPDRPLPRDVPQPLRTLTDSVRLEHATLPVPATYILTEEPDELPDFFERFADRARAQGWVVQRMQADHVPERSAPGELVELLIEAAATN